MPALNLFRLPDKTRRILLYTLTLLSALFIVFFLYQETKKNFLAEYQHQQQLHLTKITQSVSNNLQWLINDLSLIKSFVTRSDYLNSPTEHNLLFIQENLVSLMQARHSQYVQARFIDTSGQEKVRVDNKSGQTTIISDNKLQNKSHRYYFEETMKTPANSIFFSRFDLNFEQGQLEQPIRPMLRVSMKVLDNQSNPAGIVIINYDGTSFIQNLRNIARGSKHFWLVNPQGYWMIGDNREVEWAFMWPDKSDITLPNKHPAIWKEITTTQPNSEIQSAVSQHIEEGVISWIKYPLSENFENIQSAMNHWWFINWTSNNEIEDLLYHIKLEYFIWLVILTFILLTSSLLLKNIARKRDLAEKQALLIQKFYFKPTFEQAAVGMAHVSLSGNWLRVNQKLCDILGYNAEELLNLSFEAITHPDDFESDLQQIDSLLSGQQNEYALEKRFIKKDGQALWVNLTNSLIRDDQGKPDYFLKIIEDIDNRKKIEAHTISLTKKLAKTNEELENFAYVASHDLKAPLRGIENLAEWLSEELENCKDKQIEHYLTLLKSRVIRMQNLLEALLQYSRIGRFLNETQTVDTKKLINDIVRLLPDNPIIDINITCQLPVFITVMTPFEMILRNLINNAVKHCEKDRVSIEICCHDKEQFYEFSFCDDGPGIDSQFHTKIFEIFKTLKPRDEVEGSGMGLAMVKKAVENYGGTIIVKSDPKEEPGACFIFTWPKEITQEVL